MTSAHLEILIPGVFSERRDVITVSGKDAETFLQGQISQDLESLALDASAWTFVLQPGGKVESFGRVSRSADGFVLDTERGHGEALLQRLQRFCLRVEVQFALREETYQCYRGPVPAGLQAPGCIRFSWGPLEGLDGTILPAKLTKAARKLSDEEAEFVRIAIGLPSLGVELKQSTIPAQIGVVNRAVSMTKGCYTGQELVTRIASRGGNVPSKLRVVQFDMDRIDDAQRDGIAAGDEIMTPPTPGRTSRKIGTLTRVALVSCAANSDETLPKATARRAAEEDHAPRDDVVPRMIVGLSFVRREVFPPYDAIVRTGNGDLPCRLEDIPAEGQEQ